MSKGLAICTDIYDKNGNLTKIDISDENGEHILDVLWDPRDDQTSDNRIALRQWAKTMIVRKGYTVAE